MGKIADSFKKLNEEKNERQRTQTTKHKVKIAEELTEGEYSIRLDANGKAEIKPISNDKKKNILKAVDYLNKIYDIRLNSDTKEVEIRKHSTAGEKPVDYSIIDDQTYSFLDTELMMNANVSLSLRDYNNLLFSGFFFSTYHPFKDYLSRLPNWDGHTDYIRQFAEQVQLRDEFKYRNYFIEGFKRWFTALVMSLIEDTPHQFYINQTCLVFVGEQGSYKSTFFSNLVPEALRLRYFYSGLYDFHSEEAQKYLGTKILINLEELAGLNRADNESIKSRITQSQITIRLKYGRKDTFYKRRASFCATTNDQEFLTDMTGDRRFFIVPISAIQIDNDLKIDNVYSQALALYKNGFKYWFDAEDILQNSEINKEFRIETQEEEMIEMHFQVPTKEDYEHPNRVRYMNASQIADWLTEKYKRLNVNNSVKKTIGKALRKFGFVQVQKRVNGKMLRLYAVIPISDPNITSADEPEELNYKEII